jgi:polyferredoxin
LLPFWLIRRDERRLSTEQLARRFPRATFLIAVVVFGPFALPIHFVRTRRSLAGFAQGIAWLAVTLLLTLLVGLSLEKCVGIN